MLSRLRSIIPGAAHWPDFERNRSEQFESRVVMVEIMDSPSLFMQGMAGARLPIVVAHGEGRVESGVKRAGTPCRFCDLSITAVKWRTLTLNNPNGSSRGADGIYQ